MTRENNRKILLFLRPVSVGDGTIGSARVPQDTSSSSVGRETRSRPSGARINSTHKYTIKKKCGDERVHRFYNRGEKKKNVDNNNDRFFFFFFLRYAE